MRRVSTTIWLMASLILGLSQSTAAQISHWQLGGSGLAWSENDTTRLFVDFATTPGAIQPTYFTLDETVFSHIDNWAFWRDPATASSTTSTAKHRECGSGTTACPTLRKRLLAHRQRPYHL